MKKIYVNPIVNMDMSDPDVIPYKDGFLMITSSFNFVPGIPLYFSYDLVNWKFVRFIVEKLPGKKFNNVHFGHGIWAPSIRIHKDTLYVVFPTPDEGIFVCKSKDPFNSWSKPRRLLKVKGYEDPCPIWFENKTYIVHAYVKSRIGFNSKLAIFEVDEKLTKVLSTSRVIYDGTIENKTIEGPKFNIINDELFILAPAGGVENGYQVALKSKDIYGPYDYKVILKGYEDTINGPHQGALVEYRENKFVFFHFQEAGVLGRILHLQPVVIENNYPLIGEKREDFTGAPVEIFEYYLKKHTICLKKNKFTKGDFLENFTFACNRPNNSHYIKDGVFYLNCLYSNRCVLENRNSIYKAIPDSSFKFSSYLSFASLKTNDEAGVILLGLKSLIISYFNGCILIYSLDMETNNKSLLYEKKVYKKDFYINVKVENLVASIYIDYKEVFESFDLTKGKWVGAKIGLFAKSSNKKEEYGALKVYSSKIR